MEGDGGIDIPSYFLCPISLQIMRDPVTLPTGITYDRDSIERWLFTGGKNETSCPVTKQPLVAADAAELIPNHTLRRVIQAWCAAHASSGVERFPTPRAPVDRAHMAKLLRDATSPPSHMISLRKLRSIIADSERNRRCAVLAGAADVLASIVATTTTTTTTEEQQEASDEALAILCSLQISKQGLCDLLAAKPDLIESLTAVLNNRSDDQSRAYATFFLRSILETATPAGLVSLKEELFIELVRVVCDKISYKATKAALRALIHLLPWGRNRTKATEAGGVKAVVELLLEEEERRVCEMAMVVLDQLCECAKGRAELLKHAAGLAVVAKKALRVSPLATERAVSVIRSVASHSAAAPGVLQEMLQVGVVAKLCLVIQVDCGEKTKEKAMAVLRLHSRVWRSSPCVPRILLDSYPPTNR